MKKFKFSAIVVAVVTAVLVMLSACSSGPAVGSISNKGNESFKGQISEQSYEDVDAAAQAFLAAELDGKTTETKFVSYEKKQDISQDEIALLPLGDIKAEDVTSAEQGTITYEMSTTGISRTADGDAYKRTQTIYMFEVDGMWYYFVPEARNGEMISQSYYRDFWNMEHYRNCSNKVVMTMSVQIKQGKMSATANVGITSEIKISDHAMYVMKKTTVNSEGVEADIIAQALASQLGKDEESYGIEKNGKMYVATLRDGQWVTAPAIYDSIDEMFMDLIASSGQPEFLDYSYFVKTDNGFKLDSTKAKIYAANYNPMFAQTELGMDISADYVVKNERMASATAILKASGKLQGVDTKMTLSSESTYSDYGTTTVTIPDDLAAIFETLN